MEKPKYNPWNVHVGTHMTERERELPVLEKCSAFHVTNEELEFKVSNERTVTRIYMSFLISNNSKVQGA